MTRSYTPARIFFTICPIGEKLQHWRPRAHGHKTHFWRKETLAREDHRPSTDLDCSQNLNSTILNPQQTTWSLSHGSTAVGSFLEGFNDRKFHPSSAYISTFALGNQTIRPSRKNCIYQSLSTPGSFLESSIFLHGAPVVAHVQGYIAACPICRQNKKPSKCLLRLQSIPYHHTRGPTCP